MYMTIQILQTIRVLFFLYMVKYRTKITNFAFSGFKINQLISKKEQTRAIQENNKEVSRIAFCTLLCTLTSNGIVLTKSDKALFERLCGRIKRSTFNSLMSDCKAEGLIKVVSMKNGIIHYKVCTPSKWRGRRGNSMIPLKIKKTSGFREIRDSIYDAALTSLVAANTSKAKLVIDMFIRCLNDDIDPVMTDWFDSYDGIDEELSRAYKCLRMLGESRQSKKVESILKPILSKYILAVSMKQMRLVTGISKNRLNKSKKHLIDNHLILREYQYEEITEEAYCAYSQLVGEGKMKVYLTSKVVSRDGHPRVIYCKMTPNTYEINGAIGVVGDWKYLIGLRKACYLGMKSKTGRRRVVKMVSKWCDSRYFKAC